MPYQVANTKEHNLRQVAKLFEFLTPNMDVAIASSDSPAHTFFNYHLPVNIMNRAYALRHDLCDSSGQLSKAITVRLSSYSAFTVVQDLFIVDDLNADVILGRSWADVCASNTGMYC